MDCKSLSDEELVKAISQDQWKAFEELYFRYAKRVLGFYMKRIKAEEAEDLMQKCFMRIQEKAHTYDEKYPAAVWIFAVARNLMIDLFRKFKRDHKLAEGLLLDHEIQEELKAEDVWSMLQEELYSLDEKQQLIIKLRYKDGLDFNEMAKILETTADNARQLVSRAVRSLRTAVVEKE